MKKTNIFLAIPLSFGSKALYREVGKSWGGRVFGYLFVVQLIFWAFICIGIQSQFSMWVVQDAPAVLSQIPEISITNGVVSTDVEEPHFITNPENPDEVWFVIDTTGQYTELTQDILGGLMTENKVYIRQQSSLNEVRMYDLSTVPQFNMNADTVKGWLDLARTLLFWVLLPLCALGGFIWRLLLGLWYGLLGLIPNGFLAEKSDYGVIYRTAIVAMTPAMFLKLLKTLLHLNIQLFWLLSFAVGFGYLVFGLWAQSEEGRDKPEEFV